MSNVIKIVARIRLAVKSDLFLSPKEYLKPNVVYFVFCKKEQKIYRTDVTLKEKYNSYQHRELSELFIFEHLYVLDEEQSDNSICISLPIKPATPDDLKYFNYGEAYLRENFQYYIKEGTEEVSGPFTLNSKTDLYEIKSFLDQGKVYKISCDEEIELRQKIKSM